MRDADKTKDQLLTELSDMREKVAKLERAVRSSNATEPKPMKEAIPSEYFLERLEAEIDERKREEEALRASQDRYASILRAVPTGIGVAVNRVMAGVNEVLCNMTGYTKEELIGKSGRMLCPTDDDYDLSSERYRQIADHGIGTVETRWQRKGGKILDILHSSAPIDPSDLSKGMAFTGVDITERKKAEESLAEELTNKRAVFEQSPDGILIIDTQTTRFLDFNSAAHTQLGYSREEFAKLSILDVEAKETTEETRARIATVINNRRDDFETIQRTKQGEIRNVHVTAQLITIRGGRGLSLHLARHH
jgi:PAS domain S-box-containing protein